MATFEDKRIELQTKLDNLLVQEGIKVYFQPPSSGLVYPCLIYNLDRNAAYMADDLVYTNRTWLQYTLIAEDYNIILDALRVLGENFINPINGDHYMADGLYHYKWNGAVIHE